MDTHIILMFDCPASLSAFLVSSSKWGWDIIEVSPLLPQPALNASTITIAPAVAIMRSYIRTHNTYFTSIFVVVALMKM